MASEKTAQAKSKAKSGNGRSARDGAGSKQTKLPDKKTCVELLTKMALIRRFEEEAGRQYQKAKAGGFLHLAIGEEAIERGVEGIPTIAVGDELFWGDDRLEDAVRAASTGAG